MTAEARPVLQDDAIGPDGAFGQMLAAPPILVKCRCFRRCHLSRPRYLIAPSGRSRASRGWCLAWMRRSSVLTIFV